MCLWVGERERIRFAVINQIWQFTPVERDREEQRDSLFAMGIKRWIGLYLAQFIWTAALLHCIYTTTSGLSSKVKCAKTHSQTPPEMFLVSGPKDWCTKTLWNQYEINTFRWPKPYTIQIHIFCKCKTLKVAQMLGQNIYKEGYMNAKCFKFQDSFHFCSMTEIYIANIHKD